MFCKALFTILAIALPLDVSGAVLPSYDFTKAQVVRRWTPAANAGWISATPDGMLVSINGIDPYVIGPAFDYPKGQPLSISLKIKSDSSGTGQVFTFSDKVNASEERSVKFFSFAGKWTEVKLPIPSLGDHYRLRIDPPGTASATIAWVRVTARTIYKLPKWPKPSNSDFSAGKHIMADGPLKLVQSERELGGFEVILDDKRVALGLNNSILGYSLRGASNWLALNKPDTVRWVDQRTVEFVFSDVDKGKWSLKYTFSSPQHLATGKTTSDASTLISSAGSIDISIAISSSQDRDVIYLPLFGISALGKKTQALLPGLEYLADEPSSSKKDITTAEANRRVPDNTKITFPLISVVCIDHFVALRWKMDSNVSAVFDTPDRTYSSGGHIMQLIVPGSNGLDREEGSLLPYEPLTLKAGKTYGFHATLMAGRGTSAVDALRACFDESAMPGGPRNYAFEDFSSLMSAGWLDSKLSDNGKYRHAYWPGFGPVAAADAAMFMDWLAATTTNRKTKARLQIASARAITQVAPADYNAARVSHIPFMMPALIYGHVLENATRAEQTAQELMRRFNKDLGITYASQPGKPDYAKTHWSKESNGLSSQVVAELLESAMVSGNKKLIAESLKYLDALDRYDNDIPRGAQTWEVPLHTPDIMASAHLARSYTTGYELTGKQEYLDRATYWAWTGIAFIYLRDPIPDGVGRFSTIPVFGATDWLGSWFGRPVQWCGLVYADALYRLSNYVSPPTSKGDWTWSTIADNITLSGIGQTFPRSDPDRQGLLPDFYLLKPQVSDGPAINPGTLMANAPRYFHKPLMRDHRVFRASGVAAFVPATIEDVEEKTGEVSFTITGWSEKPIWILLSGVEKLPKITFEGKEIPDESLQYDAVGGRLAVRVQGSGTFVAKL